MPTASDYTPFVISAWLMSRVGPTNELGNVPMEDTAEAFGHLSVDQNKEVSDLYREFMWSNTLHGTVPLPRIRVRASIACAKPQEKCR